MGGTESTHMPPPHMSLGHGHEQALSTIGTEHSAHASHIVHTGHESGASHIVQVESCVWPPDGTQFPFPTPPNPGPLPLPR